MQIPFLQNREKNTIKGAIGRGHVSVIYDGSTRLGEALVVVLRFSDEHGYPYDF